MAGENEDEQADPSTMRFEEATAELEALITRIEEGEISLEESLAARRRGEALIKRSRAILEAAEQELQQTSPDDREEATSVDIANRATDSTMAPDADEQ